MVDNSSRHVDKSSGCVGVSRSWCLHELAELYKLQDRNNEAEPLFQRALTIREQKLGAEHPDTVATRERYTALLGKMKQEKGK